MANLFPPVEPYKKHFLKVSDVHTVYVEEAGNPNGRPIIFLHGGPGGGIDAKYRQYFDPNKWRIILFDQRGCGLSTPFGSIEQNTTFDLINDIEFIRKYLKIESMDVFGGSWGSTLALTYAICHPSRVKSLILRGIFLLRKKEIEWFYQCGASNFFPDAWESYLKPIHESERSDLLSAYHKRLFGQNEKTLKECAKSWSVWEASTSRLLPDKDLISKFQDDNFSYAFARIECHYFYNNGFFPTDNWILDNINKIKDINGVIVQGRYDMPCPPISAYELSKAWPKGRFKLIEAAGHSLSEGPLLDVLMEEIEYFGRL